MLGGLSTPPLEASLSLESGAPPVQGASEVPLTPVAGVPYCYIYASDSAFCLCGMAHVCVHKQRTRKEARRSLPDAPAQPQGEVCARRSTVLPLTVSSLTRSLHDECGRVRAARYAQHLLPLEGVGGHLAQLP